MGLESYVDRCFGPRKWPRMERVVSVKKTLVMMTGLFGTPRLVG